MSQVIVKVCQQSVYTVTKLYSNSVHPIVTPQVVEWFDREAHNISGIAGRNVYLATDEPTVFTEAQKK